MTRGIYPALLAHYPLADSLQFPWASSRVPARLSSGFPRQPLPAGHIDPLNGDFVPSVKLDLPINLSGFTKGKDVLVCGLLALVEAELAAGTMLPLPDLAFGGRYGLLSLRTFSFPAALAFIAEIRAVEAQFTQREQELAAIYC